MQRQDKIVFFSKELGYIVNPKIRNFAEAALDLVPDYFFDIPASSTGKYHPKYALGDQGLLRHVKAAVGIAMELFRLDWWHFTNDEQDLIIAALILHDGRKSGFPKQTFTVTEHPILMAEAIRDDKLRGLLPQEYVIILSNGIARHMGQWTQDYKSKKEVLERPQTAIDKFIHLCDYLASRKCLEFNFDVEPSKG